MNLSKLVIGLYVVIVLGMSAVVKAEYRILPYPSEKQTVNYVGAVAQTVDGQFYLIVDEQKEIVFKLEGHIDFSQFNGWLVKVVGVENNKYKVGPVFSVSSYDPLNEENEENVAVPSLNVLSINGIVLIEQ